MKRSFSSRIAVAALGAAVLLVVGAAVGWFVYSSARPDARFPFHYGLDLDGGTHLVYQADISKIPPPEVNGAMDALRNVIERRVNIFGVSEPLVQAQRSGIVGGGEHRLIVELPGVTDLNEAVKAIGETPLLEFRLVASQTEEETIFESTGLTGQMVQRAQLDFASGPQSALTEPIIVLHFNSEGAKLFREITTENVGRVLGIFLDGELISAPVIQEAIPNGIATISGNFTPESAKELVKNLNFGALPVPIELVSSQSIGASLGEAALDQGVIAGIWGLALVALFLVLWYRLPGVIAVLALAIYVAINLAIFKLIPVTLTTAGLAAFILSIGMAVDANILIFERTKEELREGKPLREAVEEGFRRAWLSIRDSNLSSIITGVILFWMGGTAVIKGFALVFVIGVLVSMFTAITTVIQATLTTWHELSNTFKYSLHVNDRTY